MKPRASVAGFEQHAVEIVDVLAGRVAADHVLLRLQQQRAGDRRADLARDREIRIARVDAIMQSRTVLAPAELPVVGNERRRLRKRGEGGRKATVRRAAKWAAARLALRAINWFLALLPAVEARVERSIAALREPQIPPPAQAGEGEKHCRGE